MAVRTAARRARTGASTPRLWTPTENEGEPMKLTLLGTGLTAVENGGGARWRLLVAVGSLVAAGLACGGNATTPVGEMTGSGSTGGGGNAGAGSMSGSGGTSDGGGTGSAAVGGRGETGDAGGVAGAGVAGA